MLFFLIVVSLPTPTPGPISDLSKLFVSEITQFVSTKRELSDLYRCLLSVNISCAISAARPSQGNNCNMFPNYRNFLVVSQSQNA